MISEELRTRVLELLESDSRHHEILDLDLSGESLCPARDIGVEDYLECLEPHAMDCRYAIPFGDGYLCRCVVRRTLLRELGV